MNYNSRIGSYQKGIIWKSWRGQYHSMRSAEMAVLKTTQHGVIPSSETNKTSRTMEANLTTNPLLISTTQPTTMNLARDCNDVLLLTNNSYQPGVYNLSTTDDLAPVLVFCDKGGWTVIQSRDQVGNKEDFFFAQWNDYKNGFGTPGEEHWIGLDNIFHMTQENNYTLRIRLVDTDGKRGQGFYDLFRITEDVKLHELLSPMINSCFLFGCRTNTHWKLDNFLVVEMFMKSIPNLIIPFLLICHFYSSISIGDSLSYHDKMPFTTKDFDGNYQCAKNSQGGWW